ncbi:hypothetical protein pdam_00007926, partial [Pocillopora damicornis]
MQIHCSVPQCTKKGYLKDQGTKVSYFKFPAKNLKKRLHTIRGERGKRFKVTEMTKHKLILLKRRPNSNRKLTNLRANCKIPSSKVMLFMKDSNAAFLLAFKARTLKWLFLSILILGKGVRTFPTG